MPNTSEMDRLVNDFPEELRELVAQFIVDHQPDQNEGQKPDILSLTNADIREARNMTHQDLVTDLRPAV